MNLEKANVIREQAIVACKAYGIYDMTSVILAAFRDWTEVDDVGSCTIEHLNLELRAYRARAIFFKTERVYQGDRYSTHAFRDGKWVKELQDWHRKALDETKRQKAETDKGWIKKIVADFSPLEDADETGKTQE